MNDLKREINRGFEKQQQSQLGDVSQTANRMLRTATAVRPRTGQLWPSVAGVAIVLIAGSVIGAAIVIRNLNPKGVTIHQPKPTASAVATPNPSPTALSKALAVPSTTPVILFHDPADFQQIDGITWDGTAAGRVGVDPVPATGILANLGGTLWATTRDIRDRAGTIVATFASPSKGFPGTWADDGRHYCSMVSANPIGQVGGVPTTLQLTAVGQAPRNIAQVGRAYEQASVGVAACSLESDRAVAIQANSVGQAVQFWVVQLSTGRVLWTRPSGDIRASRDGRYIAEIITDPVSHASTTMIYSSTGAVLGHVAGRIEVFSWDGSLAVQMADYGAPASVVRWRDGTILWTGPSSGGFVAAQAEPGGQRIAVGVRDPRYPQTGGFPPEDLYVIDAQGKAVELLTNVTTGF